MLIRFFGGPKCGEEIEGHEAPYRMAFDIDGRHVVYERQGEVRGGSASASELLEVSYIEQGLAGDAFFDLTQKHDARRAAARRRENGFSD